MLAEVSGGGVRRLRWKLQRFRERIALWLAPWLRPEPEQSTKLSPELIEAFRDMQERVGHRPPS
jgi:hypothetical protein